MTTRHPTGLPAALAATDRLYLRPTAICAGADARDLLARGRALALAGGPLAFAAVAVSVREAGCRTARGATVGLGELARWAGDGDGLVDRVAERLRRIAAPRASAAGGPRLMGIVNVTPDSFSDGGEHLDPEAAIAHALALAAAGAAIVDVGGESTRPGAQPLSVAEELRRVRPVLAGLGDRRADLAGALVSIDTRRAAVMRAALECGVDLINDVSALTGDPDSLSVAAASDVPVVLMHLPLPPAEMRATPDYADVALDVYDHLERRVEACVAAGIARERLIVDPGIGFGKRGEENLAVLRSLALYHGLGCPVLVGLSRKGLGDAHHRGLAPRQRLPASLAAAAQALDQGVQILRVHDVAETRQALELWTALRS